MLTVASICTLLLIAISLGYTIAIFKKMNLLDISMESRLTMLLETNKALSDTNIDHSHKLDTQSNTLVNTTRELSELQVAHERLWTQYTGAHDELAALRAQPAPVANPRRTVRDKSKAKVTAITAENIPAKDL